MSKAASLLAGVALFLAGSAAAEEPGFVSIFDGRTLEGWKVSGQPEAFKVEDGAIVANGSCSHAFYAGKVNGGTFKDFELRLEVMTRPHSNGGVYFHTEWQPEGWPAKGYEVQVNNTQEDWRKSGGLYGVVDNKEPFEDDQWMKYVVRLEDGVINVTVNGRKVVEDYKPEGDASKLLEGGGTFALQAHDPGSTVLYKNLRVKPLK